MVEFSYFLAESAIRVAGRRVVIFDPYDDAKAEPESIEGLEVDLVHVAQSDLPLNVSLNHGDRAFDASFTPDGRIQSLEYNSTGAGTRVVAGVGKLVAYVGSVLLGVHRGGGDKRALLTARAVWENAYPDMASHKEAYVQIAKNTGTALAQVRASMIDEVEARALRQLEIRARVLEGLLRDATDEVAKIETLYAEWRAAQRTTSDSEVAVRILVADLPRRIAQGDAAPEEPVEGQRGYELWKHCGLYLEVIDSLRPDLPDGPPAIESPSSQGSAFQSWDFENPNFQNPSSIWWRQPREVELWVWKLDGGQVAPVSRSTIRISDQACSYGSMEITSSVFGQHGGSLTFNDEGSPSRVSHNQESAWAAFADALGGIPEAVGTGVTQAKNVMESLTSIQDAHSERERARTARELEIAENRLKLAGVAATEEDYANLQRAEQAVKFQTARRSLSPAAVAVEDLQQQLDLVTKQNKLDSERRSAAVENSLADLRAEVARLEVQVSKVEALGKLPE
jgi:hypothetical protein